VFVFVRSEAGTGQEAQRDQMMTSASCRIYHNRSIVNGHFFTFPSSHVSPPSSTPPSSLSIGRGAIHVNGLIMSVLRPRARGADSMLSADVGSLYEAGPGEGAWQLVSGPTPVPGLLERGQERERETAGYWREELADGTGDGSQSTTTKSFVLAPIWQAESVS